MNINTFGRIQHGGRVTPVVASPPPSFYRTLHGSLDAHADVRVPSRHVRIITRECAPQ